MGLIDVNRQLVRLYRLHLFCEDTIKQFLISADTVDAEPVRHGMWMWHSVIGEAFYVKECSVCGWTHALNSNYLYCPNCGAKMDKEKDDG